MTRLLTTREVADLLAVSPDYVRDHAAELGAIRVGPTNRAPLRFELASIEAWKDRQRLAPPPAERKPQRPGPKRSRAGFPLLPVLESR